MIPQTQLFYCWFGSFLTLLFFFSNDWCLLCMVVLTLLWTNTVCGRLHVLISPLLFRTLTQQLTTCICICVCMYVCVCVCVCVFCNLSCTYFIVGPLCHASIVECKGMCWRWPHIWLFKSSALLINQFNWILSSGVLIFILDMILRHFDLFFNLIFSI